MGEQALPGTLAGGILRFCAASGFCSAFFRLEPPPWVPPAGIDSPLGRFAVWACAHRSGRNSRLEQACQFLYTVALRYHSCVQWELFIAAKGSFSYIRYSIGVFIWKLLASYKFASPFCSVFALLAECCDTCIPTNRYNVP